MIAAGSVIKRMSQKRSGYGSPVNTKVGDTAKYILKKKQRCRVDSSVQKGF